MNPPRASNNLIRDFIRQDIEGAIDAFEITRKIEHQGLKGKTREIFVQKLFRSLLSHDFQFGSGIITDQFGNQAKETDVILYSAEIMPARDAEEAAGIFPIEACIYTIEVKSSITAAEIADAVEKGKALSALESVYFNNLGPISSRPITALFAFSSDMKSGADAEFARFRSIIDAAGNDRFGVPYLRVLCIVGKGYWYWARNESGPGWFRLSANGPLDEVVGMTAGLLNTVRSEKLQRYGLPFGNYLLTDAPVIKLS